MESADLQDAEKTRALRLDRYRLDPLRFVDWAFPWGSGLLADHKGPEKWQADVLRDYAERGTVAGDARGRTLHFDPDVELRIYRSLPTQTVVAAAHACRAPIAFIGGTAGTVWMR